MVYILEEVDNLKKIDIVDVLPKSIKENGDADEETDNKDESKESDEKTGSSEKPEIKITGKDCDREHNSPTKSEEKNKGDIIPKADVKTDVKKNNTKGKSKKTSTRKKNVDANTQTVMPQQNINNQPQTQVLQNNKVLPQQPKKSGIPKILVVGLVVILAVGVGYYFYSKKKKENEVQTPEE